MRLMSTGYLVMRWVTSRMHSCTPCLFSTAERVTFYKDRDRVRACEGPAGGRLREHRAWSLCSGTGPNSAADLTLA